jgi:hypothetical protein
MAIAASASTLSGALTSACVGGPVSNIAADHKEGILSQRKDVRSAPFSASYRGMFFIRRIVARVHVQPL